MPHFFPSAAVRLTILSGLGLMALYAGFAHFSPEECRTLVRVTGYWWSLALVLSAASALIWCLRENGWSRFWSAVWPGRRHALLIALLALWVLGQDRPGHKIQLDESVLGATALMMHQEREFGVATRAYPLAGEFTILRVNVDKRPPMFPFLVSVLHDLTGFRPANAIITSVGGTLLLLWATWLLGRRYGGSPAAGSLAVALLASFPELGVCATSAGMDLVNLMLVAVTWLAALAWLDRPTSARAALLVTTTLVLVYSRYESVLYVGAAGLVWLAHAVGRRRWLPEAAWGVLPMGLLLYAWHHTVLSNSPDLWELRPGQTVRFSAEYLAHNLEHALRFLFVPSRDLPNSPLLTLGGFAGGLWLTRRVLHGRTTLLRPELTTLVAFGGTIFASLTLLMFYHWGELDDPVAARLSLPLHLLFTCLTVAGWREVLAQHPGLAGWRGPAWAALGAALVFTMPATALARYSESHLLRLELEWQQRVVSAQASAPDLVISNRSPLVWISARIPSISVDRARLRGVELHWFLQQHPPGNVLVCQRLTAPGPDGSWTVEENDRLPPDWLLEEVAVRRFGPTLCRISRLASVPAAE